MDNNLENPHSNPNSEFGDPHHGLNSRSEDNSPVSSITSHISSSSSSLSSCSGDVSKSSLHHHHYQSDVLGDHGGQSIPEEFYPPHNNVVSSSTGNSNSSNLEANNSGSGGPVPSYFPGSAGSYGDFSNLVSQHQHHHNNYQPHTAPTPTPFDFMSLAASTQGQSYANHPSYWPYYHSQNHFAYPWAASMAASNAFINSQHHPYFMSNQMMTSSSNVDDDEAIKLEKDYYEASTDSSPALALNLNPGSNQVCLPDQLNALGYSRSDLAKVTLKKPRVTFTSQQVLQLEQEFKVQR